MGPILEHFNAEIASACTGTCCESVTDLSDTQGKIEEIKWAAQSQELFDPNRHAGDRGELQEAQYHSHVEEHGVFVTEVGAAGQPRSICSLPGTSLVCRADFARPGNGKSCQFAEANGRGPRQGPGRCARKTAAQDQRNKLWIQRHYHGRCCRNLRKGRHLCRYLLTETHAADGENHRGAAGQRIRHSPASPPRIREDGGDRSRVTLAAMLLYGPD